MATASTALLLGTALILGAMHSFQPDHLAAVGVFVSRRPSWREALALGARWGLGHSLSILLVGGALVVSGLRLPARFEPSLDRVVGATLIVLGLLAIRRALRLHAHVHAHDSGEHWHLHSHARSEAHDHGHGALLGIGMLHGLAGSGALVVLLPTAVATSRFAAITYLAVFGLGTICSMSVFGAAAGWVLRAAAHRSASLIRGFALAASAISIAVGAVWLATGGW
jgi:sulfite exporter TauE/SafE